MKPSRELCLPRDTFGGGTMESRRRVFRSSALVWSLILVGCFVAFASSAVFLAGSKSNPAFQFVPPKAPVPTPPQEPPKAPNKPAGSYNFVDKDGNPPDPPKAPAKTGPATEPPR